MIKEQGNIHALQHLWFNRALTLDPIARDWRNLSKEQFNNYRTSPEFQAMFPALLKPEAVSMIVPTPIIAMTTPVEQAIILKHVLENVLKEDPGSPLACALDQHGCQSIQDVMALTPWEIESMKWTDGSSPTSILPRGPRSELVTFQAFVLSLHPNPSSIVMDDWLSLSYEQYSTFKISAEYMHLRQHSPRPVPPHDDNTDDTKKIIHRSNVHTALDPTTQDKRVDPPSGEESQPPYIIVMDENRELQTHKNQLIKLTP